MYDETTATIKVETRIAGKRLPLHTPWHVVLPASFSHSTSDANRPLRLRDLLEHIIREEVRAFQLRKEVERLSRGSRSAPLDRPA